jgi:hypothetical protein
MATRRDFMRSISLGSALYASTPLRLFAQSSPDGEQIANQFFTARFDAANGLIHVERKDGAAFLRNAVARIAMGGVVRRSSEPEYRRTCSVRSLDDSLGKGHQITAQCVDQRKQVDFEVLLTLYDGRDAVIVEVICRNASTRNARVLRIEPVRAVLEEDGYCGWADASKVLTNGYMYPDPGRVEELGQSNRHATTSMWNMGFYRGERDEGLVVGYLDNKVATGSVSAMYDRTVIPARSHGGMSLIAESIYNVEYVLQPGASTSSGRVMFNIGRDPFTALEDYAQAVADNQNVHLNPVINGWCSWFYTHEYINEEEVVRNTEFAARALKPYGLEYAQIDAGWFRTYGEWEGNERFPHGMKWLAEQIRGHGFRAGLWLAPYCIAEGTEVYERHQDWLITDRDGKVKQCGGGLSAADIAPYGIPSMTKKIYGLDVTQQAAAVWMHDLFKKVSEEWGYDFIKIDFVEWTILSAERYRDSSVSQAAAYRKGFEIMRTAIGPKRHLLDCGPMNNTVGLLDSARIELDQPRLTWEQYTANFNSSGPAMAKRYYFNQKTWINDADHLGLALLSLPQARAAASIIALSGGTLISGDRLVELDKDRLAILSKVCPSYGVAARPIDLFETDRPEIFELAIRTDFGEWSVVALFNYSSEATEKRVLLKRLRVPESKNYVAFEFWSQQLIGEVETELKVRVEAESVALLSVHSMAETPRVVSTDRHFTQGAIELKSVAWDEASNTLSGTSTGEASITYTLSVYVPPSYRWVGDQTDNFQESSGFTISQVFPSLLRVRCQFEAGTETSWQIRFKSGTH